MAAWSTQSALTFWARLYSRNAHFVLFALRSVVHLTTVISKRYPNSSADNPQDCSTRRRNQGDQPINYARPCRDGAPVPRGREGGSSCRRRNQTPCSGVAR